MTDRRSMLITGAYGYIGSSLSEYFSEKGWNVTKLVRNPGNRPDAFGYDLGKAPDENLFHGASYVIHCAVQHYSAKERNADSLNQEAAKRLAAICSRTGTRIIFLSTLSAHPGAESHYGKSKLAVEKLLLHHHSLVLRLGLVLGNGGLFSTLSGLIKKSRFIPLIGGGKPLQTIALDDLCRIIDAAIEKDLEGSFDIAEPGKHSMKDFYKAVAALHGMSPVFVPFPIPLALLASRFFETARIPFPVKTESVLGLRQLRHFDTKDDLEKIGVKVKTMEESLNALATE